ARGEKECNQVVGYEHLVEQAFPGKPVIALCQYATHDFRPQTLEGVLAAHKIHLVEDGQTHVSLSLAFESHTAEIVANRTAFRPTFHYVVQEQKYPHDVLGWGMEADFHAANDRVRRLVSHSATKAQVS